MPTVNDAAIHGDLLKGADAIAEFVFGDRKERRRVYNLKDRGYLPVFQIGATVCARKTTLLAWIEAQERASIRSAA